MLETAFSLKTVLKFLGSSIHTYLAGFYYIGLDISVPIYPGPGPGPDNKTHIVEPICPIINMDISALKILVPI